jgi:hypothetical protein
MGTYREVVAGFTETTVVVADQVDDYPSDMVAQIAALNSTWGDDAGALILTYDDNCFTNNSKTVLLAVHHNPAGADEAMAQEIWKSAYEQGEWVPDWDGDFTEAAIPPAPSPDDWQAAAPTQAPPPWPEEAAEVGTETDAGGWQAARPSGGWQAARPSGT